MEIEIVPKMLVLAFFFKKKLQLSDKKKIWPYFKSYKKRVYAKSYFWS